MRLYFLKKGLLLVATQFLFDIVVVQHNRSTHNEVQCHLNKQWLHHHNSWQGAECGDATILSVPQPDLCQMAIWWIWTQSPPVTGLLPYLPGHHICSTIKGALLWVGWREVWNTQPFWLQLKGKLRLWGAHVVMGIQVQSSYPLSLPQSLPEIIWTVPYSIMPQKRSKHILRRASWG